MGDIHKLMKFINKYLDDETTVIDFLRVKGVVEVKGKDERYVIQCVHMMKQMSFDKTWARGEVRESKMIFIGRGMEQRRKELTEGFMDCVWTGRTRFAKGAKVLANLG